MGLTTALCLWSACSWSDWKPTCGGGSIGVSELTEFSITGPGGLTSSTPAGASARGRDDSARPAADILLLQATLPVMVPATVCLVSLIQGLLDELHHIRSVLGHAMMKCYHAAEHGNRSLRSARRPILFEPVNELRDQHKNQGPKAKEKH